MFLSHQDFRKTDAGKFDSMVGSENAAERQKYQSGQSKPAPKVGVQRDATSWDTQTARTGNEDGFGRPAMRNSKSQAVNTKSRIKNGLNLRKSGKALPLNLQVQAELRGVSLQLR